MTSTTPDSSWREVASKLPAKSYSRKPVEPSNLSDEAIEAIREWKKQQST